MVSEPVQVALIVGGIGMLSTLLLAVVTGLVAHASRRADWRRQDTVAEKAALLRKQEMARQDEVAAKLLAAQQETIARTEAVAELAKRAARDTASQFDAIQTQGQAIHILVNRELTNVTEKALAAFIELRAELEANLEEAGGRGDREQLDIVKRSIAGLRTELVHRAEQQAMLDAAEEQQQSTT